MNNKKILMTTGRQAGRTIAFWDHLKAEVVACTKCALCRTRTNVVFGEGALNADLMIIGEGPGYNEDQEGRPFVGRSGKKLDKWIESLGLERQDVFITNIVKCRPPDNRDPEREEAQACKDYLMQQIALVKPKIICTLGRPATHLLLETEEPMRNLINRELEFNGIIVIPIYHPAFVLRNPYKQEDVNKGLKLIKEKL
jgi:DNA polymerase